MSVLFALLMMTVLMTVSYFLQRRRRRHMPVPLAQTSSPKLLFPDTLPLKDIPAGYFFHPCHTWAVDEGRDSIRVGVDDFAANLFGKLDGIVLSSTNRWVRQGQRLMTVGFGGVSVDLPSPVEGIVMLVNDSAIGDPDLITRNPFSQGWVAVIKAPSFASDCKNLLRGPMAASWMRNSILVLRQAISHSPQFAQDGGRPISGILQNVSPALRRSLVKELLQTVPIEPIHPMQTVALK